MSFLMFPQNIICSWVKRKVSLQHIRIFYIMSENFVSLPLNVT